MKHIRHANRFDFSINIADEIDDSNIQIPPIIIQPIVENAIKYGIDPSRTTNSIEIEISSSDTSLHIEVNDSGSGSPPKSQNTSSKSSKGLQITQRRILSWGKKHEFTHAELEKSFSLDGGPSKVALTLPLAMIF